MIGLEQIAEWEELLRTTAAADVELSQLTSPSGAIRTTIKIETGSMHGVLRARGNGQLIPWFVECIESLLSERRKLLVAIDKDCARKYIEDLRAELAASMLSEDSKLKKLR